MKTKESTLKLAGYIASQKHSALLAALIFLALDVVGG